MPDLTPILSREDIANRVADLANTISKDYKDRDLVLIGILKGSFIFLSDLLRGLTIPAEVDFVCASTYGSGTASSGNIRLTKSPDIDIKHRDILIVEDIIDTGLTSAYCAGVLNALGPRSVKLCAMVDKTERREKSISVDYACLTIDAGFLVGYGLDYDQKYRGLAGIYVLNEA